MTLPLLLLRPQPGNDASAARARAKGLVVIQCPLFAVEAMPADSAPEGPFDALLVTSANGARFGRDVLNAHAGVPAYATGDATARALREAGHTNVISAGGTAADAAAMIGQAGFRRVLHIAGKDVRPFDPGDLDITRVSVYRSVPRRNEDVSPCLSQIGGAVAAIHSARAGARLAALVGSERRTSIHLAAISQMAGDAAESGWASIAIATNPDDSGLLACAETLCIRDGQ